MTQEPVSSPTHWPPRQIMLATLAVVSIAASFWLVYRFRLVVLVLFIAIVLGTAMKPAVDWLARRRIPRVTGEVLIYIFLLVSLIGFLLLTIPLILEQSTALINLLSEYYRGLRSLMLLSPSSLIQRLGIRLPFQLQMQNLVQPATPPAATPAANAGDAVAQALHYAGLFTQSIFSLIAVFLMAFYWTLEGDRAIRFIVLLVPSENRENVREMVEAIQGKLGGYLFGQLLLSLTIAIMSLAAYLLIGLPNALVLALIAGVMESVPMVGPILGALPALLVAASADPAKVPWVLAAAAITQLIENNLLVPRIMDRSVGVHPLLTLLSFAALSSLFGLAGAVMAVPIAAIIQLTTSRYLLNQDDTATPQPVGRDRVSYLRLQANEIAQDIRKQVRKKEETVDRTSDQVEDAIETLANDLDGVLAQMSHEETELP
ncbi:MAG TPA: AI-2E family transporter [Anaerolineales bacterium]